VQRGSQRPHRTSLGMLLVLLLLAPPATAAQRAPAVEDERSTASLAAPPTDTTPLLADFDGDNRTDLFWYGPGGKADHLWLGRPDRNFVGAPVTVGRGYLPVVGDFNGNGRADILWYGPGSEPDALWFGRPGGRFSGGRAISVGRTYEPLPGDFNGDGYGDIFWYGPGSAPDVLWYGHADGRSSGRPINVAGTYQPLLGDFNGDRRRDILWYGPGARHDALWLGRGGGGFAPRSVTVGRTFQPIIGDFNGDLARDILWYGPGAAPDVLWFGHRDGRFSGRPIDVAGRYQPFTGDFNGDGRRDIFWYGPGGGYDVIWYGSSTGRFGPGSAPVAGTYQPLVGDFGGGGPNDVLWWAPGPGNDVLWFGHANRRFTSRSTTVDLDYDRALAIRPETLAGQYDPYGFVAHAFGAIDGRLYSNTLEAFQRNYGRGFRVFECDNVRLADGTVLLAHDGLEANYGLNKPFQEATWADLAGRRYLSRYTVLRSQNLLRLLVDHPDVFVIPDPKYSRPAIFRSYVRQAAALGRLDLMKRVLPHVADQAELNALRVYYPLQSYVLALYHTQAQNRYDDAEAIAFVRRNRTPAAMMWAGDRNPALSLAANGRQGRRFRQSFANGLRAAGAVVYVHSLGDPAQIQRFWDLGIGVYSNDPFPPLGAAPTVLETPRFGPRVEADTPPA
jgi:glycerophosphoryl diester phosphodiesterase